jgi:hypothetical protein
MGKGEKTALGLFKINGSILGAFQILYLPSCTFSLIKDEPAAAAVPFGVKQKSTASPQIHPPLPGDEILISPGSHR